MNAIADVWATSGRLSEPVRDDPVPRRQHPRAGARCRACARYGCYRAAFLDYDDRRIWVIAPPRAAGAPGPAAARSSTVTTICATRRIREGGWARRLATRSQDRAACRSATRSRCRPHARRASAWPRSAPTSAGRQERSSSTPTTSRARGEAPSRRHTSSCSRPARRRRRCARTCVRVLGRQSGFAVETQRSAHRPRTARRAARDCTRLTQIALLVLARGRARDGGRDGRR